MTDQELLELAAKAACLKVWRGFGFQKNMLYCETNPDPSRKVTGIQWNPLARDGDTFRLAVKLKMAITISNHETHCEGPCGEYAYQKHQTDANAATRRAIVLCAVEIAQAML